MKRKPLTLLMISIGLLLTMISISSVGYTDNLTLAATLKTKITIKIPPLDLVLPEPIESTVDKVTFITEAYPIILQIYNGYILWADTHIAVSELEILESLRLELCSERLTIRNDAIQILSKDRDHAYTLFDMERNDKKKLEVRNTLKIVLVSTGTGVIGVAIGIITGLIIARK